MSAAESINLLFIFSLYIMVFDAKVTNIFVKMQPFRIFSRLRDKEMAETYPRTRKERSDRAYRNKINNIKIKKGNKL